MDQHFIKITYHSNDNKSISAYFETDPWLETLESDVKAYLFEERKQTPCEIRFHWKGK